MSTSIKNPTIFSKMHDRPWCIITASLKLKKMITKLLIYEQFFSYLMVHLQFCIKFKLKKKFMSNNNTNSQ